MRGPGWLPGTSKWVAPMTIELSIVEPSCTCARMPTIELLIELPVRMLPSQRIVSTTSQRSIFVPGRNRGWV